jgi:hypothetical protein
VSFSGFNFRYVVLEFQHEMTRNRTLFVCVRGFNSSRMGCPSQVSYNQRKNRDASIEAQCLKSTTNLGGSDSSVTRNGFRDATPMTKS